MPGITGVGP